MSGLSRPRYPKSTWQKSAKVKWVGSTLTSGLKSIAIFGEYLDPWDNALLPPFLMTRPERWLDVWGPLWKLNWISLVYICCWRFLSARTLVSLQISSENISKNMSLSWLCRLRSSCWLIEFSDGFELTTAISLKRLHSFIFPARLGGESDLGFNFTGAS